jgi:hypothetical protein
MAVGHEEMFMKLFELRQKVYSVSFHNHFLQSRTKDLLTVNVELYAKYKPFLHLAAGQKLRGSRRKNFLLSVTE